MEIPPVIITGHENTNLMALSLGQYHRLKNLNRISKTDHGLIVNARYDPELGLLVDEADHSDVMV